MNEREPILAERLGMTVHVSVLRHRLCALQKRFPSPGCRCLEDWLVDVANGRGARIVVRPNRPNAPFTPPAETELSNEELVVGLCQLQALDRPQMIRLAAELITRGAARVSALALVARRERVERVLAELARQALRVDAAHPQWRQIAEAFGNQPRLRSAILHWTRLAQPVMKDGRCNAASWKLVA